LTPRTALGTSLSERRSVCALDFQTDFQVEKSPPRQRRCWLQESPRSSLTQRICGSEGAEDRRERWFAPGVDGRLQGVFNFCALVVLAAGAWSSSLTVPVTLRGSKSSRCADRVSLL
jgi:hypothetical protein